MAKAIKIYKLNMQKGLITNFRLYKSIEIAELSKNNIFSYMS